MSSLLADTLMSNIITAQSPNLYPTLSNEAADPITAFRLVFKCAIPGRELARALAVFKLLDFNNGG